MNLIKTTYNILAPIGLTLYSPALLARLASERAYRRAFTERFGYIPSAPRPAEDRASWIHAVSIGEARAAEALRSELSARDKSRLALSCSTTSGRALIESTSSPGTSVFYLPFDLRPFLRRAIKRINPSRLILIDTELWPNLIWSAAEFGAKVIIANGRISDRSYGRYLRLRSVFEVVLRDVDLILAQSDEDAGRFIEIGAPPERVVALGSLKFDAPIRALDEQWITEKKRALKISDSMKTIIIGSAREGEESLIAGAIQAFESARAAGIETRIIVAPRRIENVDWIEKVAAKFRFRIERVSRVGNSDVGAALSDRDDDETIMVFDLFGQLRDLYALADIAVIGGSIIAHGGQNPLEPAAHGAPILFGEHMSNFKSVARALIEADAAIEVDSTESVAREIGRLLADPARRARMGAAAKNLVDSNRGVAAESAGRILAL